MEKKSLRKTGVGRRSFLSGSSLLLTGALLGASEEMEAKEEQTRIAPSATPQDKDRTVCSRILWLPIAFWPIKA